MSPILEKPQIETSMISTAPKTMTSDPPPTTKERPPLSFSPTDRFFRTLVHTTLARVSGGSITIDEGNDSITFGGGTGELSTTIEVHHRRFYRRLVLGGNLGAADSLIAGDWTCDDLTALVRIFVRTEYAGRDLNTGKLSLFRTFASRLTHWLRRNTVVKSRRNIQQHYDLGNDFYALWLDDTMTYSSGIFESPQTTMRDASIAKIDRICQQLNLQPNDHLLEIGTGWGALALHAAREYGCRVTTTTISDEQHAEASRRITAAGLSHRITLLKKDYRHLTGVYDKIASVEMIEAVGHEYYPQFFESCARLLKEDGAMVLQGIVIADEFYESHIRSTDFISQYIFPGGSLPSISTLVSTAAGSGGMRTLELLDIAPHYAETLRRWRTEFYRHLDQIRALGFDDQFIRMWEYYLCYCEAAFEERRVNVVQIHFAKRGCKSDRLGGFECGPAGPLISLNA